MPRRKAPVIPDDLLDQLLARGDAATALNSGGLLDALKKALPERALNAEMDYHLDDAGEAGNTRNDYGRKTVTTGTGKVEIEVPRDRMGTFDPQLIAWYQRRFPSFDDKIICAGHEHPGDQRASARDLRHRYIRRPDQHDHRCSSRRGCRLAATSAGRDLSAGPRRGGPVNSEQTDHRCCAAGTAHGSMVYGTAKRYLNGTATRGACNEQLRDITIVLFRNVQPTGNRNSHSVRRRPEHPRLRASAYARSSDSGYPLDCRWSGSPLSRSDPSFPSLPNGPMLQTC